MNENENEKHSRKQKGRGSGEGSIFERKGDARQSKKNWIAQITLENGKKKQFYCETYKEAQQVLRKALAEQEQGKLITEKDQTLEQYMVHWLEKVHKHSIRLATYIKYRGLLKNHILPALGNVKLRKLTPQQVDAFYHQKLEEGLSNSLLTSIHGLLHLAMKNAVRQNMVTSNVCDAVNLPRYSRSEAPSLSKEQAQTFLEVVRGHRLEALLTLALTTGLRRGEILALQWQDLNWNEGSLQVCRSVNRYSGQGYKIMEPKTKRSRRKVMLPKFVLEILKSHRATQLEARLAAGATWQDRNLVFCSKVGGFMRPDDMLKAFQKLLKEAGLPHMRFHDLRHSAISLLLAMGVPIKVVQEIAGHSNISVTLGTYGHVLPGMQEEAMSKWNDVFGRQ